MPGPTTLALMLFPVVVGALLSLLLVRRSRPSDWRVSGAWLVLVALPIAVLCDQLRPRVSDPALLNRAEAVALSVVALWFVLLNRRGGRVTSTASTLVGVGVWLNSVGVLVYGYMPVLERAARAADNPFTASHPSPGYVRSEDLGAFGVLIGDVIPIPHALKVLSIGDLCLFAGCILLLALFLARMWSPNPESFEAMSSVSGEEVSHG